MNVLGICVSHEANASIFIDDVLVAAVAEERFSRLKMDMRYPKNAIEFCIKYANIQPAQLDCVVLVTENDFPEMYMVNRIASFSVDDFIKEQHEYWKPVIFDKKSVNYLKIFSDKICDNYYDLSVFLNADMTPEEKSVKYLQIRMKAIANHLKIDESKIKIVKHEHAHAYYGLYAGPIRDKALVITVEGGGEYSNSTVSIFDNNRLKELNFTKKNHLGHLYKFATLILGMKPTHHEYKVMGLAPYANKKEVDKAYSFVKNIFKLDGLNVGINEGPKDFYFSFLKKFEGCRFDGIAGAVQKVVEEIMAKWVNHCCMELNVSNVVLSGGVAQNIKACQVIGELDIVDNICVAPISGDGSLSIGGCYCAIDRDFEKRKLNKSDIKPIENIYLGPEYSIKEIDDAVFASNLSQNCKILENVNNNFIVDQLINDKVIARFSSRMEFGQRALGNRSLIANPKNAGMIKKINDKIKFRDFWMPFTPTILKEYESEYIINPKKFETPYMTLSFHSTDLFQQKAPAAIHPADKTVRPQILKRAQNPEYYDLIKLFCEKTGIGSVLNTSLNLHGEPMACSPQDAVHTFINSGIDILLFDHIAIVRE